MTDWEMGLLTLKAVPPPLPPTKSGRDVCNEIRAAKAEEMRQRIIGHLRQHGPMTTNHLIRDFKASRGAIDNHMAALMERGAVARSKVLIRGVMSHNVHSMWRYVPHG